MEQLILDPIDWDDVKATLSSFDGVYIGDRQNNGILDYDLSRIAHGFIDYKVPLIENGIPGPYIYNIDPSINSKNLLRKLNPKYDFRCYPEKLKDFYLRKVEWRFWGDIKLMPGKLFVKANEKLEHPGPTVFDGPYIETSGLPTCDDIGLAFFDDCDEMYVSDAVEFVNEWRVFTARGKILDIRPYHGDVFKTPDLDFIRKAISAWDDIPAGCGIDFGVLVDGRTSVIESNDGVMLGSYGLDPVLYAYLHACRWMEILNSPIKEPYAKTVPDFDFLSRIKINS